MNQRGQASILMAFIFQVVFVFFATVINIGMLVHDKINLQNSVDIAAYYVAVKQAEMLNAIAHSNYQIRQAWKLLAYRTWIVGEAGRNMELLNRGDLESEERADFVRSDQCLRKNPVICTENQAWYDVQERERKNPRGGRIDACRVTHINTPDLRPRQLIPIEVFPLTLPYAEMFKRTNRQLLNDYHGNCREIGIRNHVAATRFIASFKESVRPRLLAIQKLEKLMMTKGSELVDLDNASVSQGVTSLLRKNLTITNSTGLQDVRVFNSVGDVPTPFINPIDVRAALMYLDVYETPTGCQYVPKTLLDKPKAAGTDYQTTMDIAERFQKTDLGTGQAVERDQFLDYDFTSKNTSPISAVGVEKDPWVLIYGGVRAEVHSRNLFAPKDGIRLVAESYAMPFGGKIGPWYYDVWPRGSTRSEPGVKIDLTLPRRRAERLSSPTFNQCGNEVADYTPNYARFPGDDLGMRAGIARKVYTSFIAMDTSQIDRTFKLIGADADYGDHILDPEVKDGLAFRQNGESYARYLEQMAIAPDLFDVTYYSIDPDYRKNVYDRLSSLFGLGEEYARLDLGYRNSAQQNNYGVAQQLLEAAKVLNTNNDAFWVVRDLNHIYSSWAQEDSDTYTPAGQISRKIAKAPLGGRGGGGRTGYSVKIVGRDFFSRDLQLGGAGAPPGKIKNPPAKLAP